MAKTAKPIEGQSVKKTGNKHQLPPGPGRPKGTPNKTTTLLKEAIILAADQAGGKEGLVGYLKKQAEENPGPFMALLGKVIPLQVTGEEGGAIKVVIQGADAGLL